MSTPVEQKRPGPLGADMTLSAAKSQRGPWLLGPVPDLLFGCGLRWMGVFALRSVAAPQVAAWVSALPLLFAFSIPHYGATLIRAYESPAIRRKHSFLTVYVSVFLSALFAACLYSPLLGSAVLTLYLTWSPWHYSGQNYGIFLALLGRRNVRPDASVKRWIYGSFCFAFALTFLSLHSAAQASYAPVTYAGTVYRLLSIELPAGVSNVLVSIAATGYVACLAGLLIGLGRKIKLRAIAPCFLVLLLQAMWFVVPAALAKWGQAYGVVDSAGLYSAYGFLWIAAAHAVQYLWFCTYYATRSNDDVRILPYLGKCYLGGAAIWILPGVLFGPSLFGRLSADAGLAVMIASFVNLHHFVLDGAIWKLGDESVSRVLFRPGSAAAASVAAHAETTSRRRFRLGMAICGGIAIACVALNMVETRFGFEAAMQRGDLDRARTALDRIAWVGTDSSLYRTQLGQQFAARSDPKNAREQLAKSLALQPTPLAWFYLGRLDEAESDWEAATRAYETALALDPDHVPSLSGAGSVRLRMQQPKQALVHLEHAVRLVPGNSRLRSLLARARRAAQRE